MPKAELLLDLQDIDSTIDRLKRRLAEIRAALHETGELIAAAQLCALPRNPLPRNARSAKIWNWPMQRSSSASRMPIDGCTAELSKPQGAARSATRYRLVEKQKNALDDQLFAAMVALEEAEAELQACTDTLRRVDAEWRASQGELAPN